MAVTWWIPALGVMRRSPCPNFAILTNMWSTGTKRTIPRDFVPDAASSPFQRRQGGALAHHIDSNRIGVSGDQFRVGTAKSRIALSAGSPRRKQRQAKVLAQRTGRAS